VSGVREGRRTGSAHTQVGGPLEQRQIFLLYFTFLFQPVYLPSYACSRVELVHVSAGFQKPTMMLLNVTMSNSCWG